MTVANTKLTQNSLPNLKVICWKLLKLKVSQFGAGRSEKPLGLYRLSAENCELNCKRTQNTWTWHEPIETKQKLPQILNWNISCGSGNCKCCNFILHNETLKPFEHMEKSSATRARNIVEQLFVQNNLHFRSNNKNCGISNKVHIRG